VRPRPSSAWRTHDCRRTAAVYHRASRVGPYRPYYYGYRPGLTVGFYTGLATLTLPVPIGVIRYFRIIRRRYGYSAATAPAYVSAVPVACGGVRLQDAPSDGRLIVDGYYMGVVDDFDGSVPASEPDGRPAPDRNRRLATSRSRST